MRVGVTDCLREDKYNLYVRWIEAVDAGVDIVRLSGGQPNVDEVAGLDGVMLTGGGDVHPRFYGGPENSPLLKDVNEQRDMFELKVVDRALENALPILAVCRGMQVMNVHLGGSLHVDLPSAGFNRHASGSSTPLQHAIAIRPHSMLHALAGAMQAEVNSYHHQGVDRLGHGLVESARSDDGLVEAAEWALKDSAPFLLMVQWHPERQPESELSKNLARLFLREVNRNRQQHAVP